jgi:hypothetical protein
MLKRVGTKSKILGMENYVDAETFDIRKFAENLVKAGREGVKWERRKLEWIREEEKKRDKSKSDAA